MISNLNLHECHISHDLEVVRVGLQGKLVALDGFVVVPLLVQQHSIGVPAHLALHLALENGTLGFGQSFVLLARVEQEDGVHGHGVGVVGYHRQQLL